MGISQRYCSALGFFLLISVGAWAENPHHPSPVFHAFWFEAQHGGGSEGGITDIELDGWMAGWLDRWRYAQTLVENGYQTAQGCSAGE